MVVAQDRKHYGWRVLAIALLVLVLAVAYKQLFFVLVPYGGQTEAIWAQYYSMANADIDTLIAGSSYGMECVDPELLDRELGWSSYSLATPYQSNGSTLRAIKDAYEDHHIKRLLLCVGIDKLTSGAEEALEYDVAFAHGESLGTSPLRSLAAHVSVMTRPHYFGTAQSFAPLIPFSLWHVDLNPEAIEANIALRRSCTPQEACEQQGLSVTERGHIPHYGEVNLDVVDVTAHAAEDEEYVFADGVQEQYRAIYQYCREQGITVYTIATPWPDYSVVRFNRAGGYAVAMSAFEKLAREGGSELLDFALVRPEYFDATISDFHDAWHLNAEGAQRFSRVLAQALARLEAGEDIQNWFFEHTEAGWDEYLTTVEGISALTFDYEVADDEVLLEFTSFGAPDLRVEYEVWELHEDGEPKLVMPYTETNTFSYPTKGAGAVELLVRGRQVGSTAEAERSCCYYVHYGI